jgi:predicted DNA-binding transcriptional regulator AlpA|tara:strand:+ start:444 stop:692 length:249 start_codon:yes stop_codon:yes gene_type:complete
MSGKMETYDIKLHSIEVQLNRIEKKIDGKYSRKFLDINQVADFCSLSISSIRRYAQKGELKCSRKSGKLLFKVEWVDRWLNG